MTMPKIPFPCERMPQDAGDARLLGLYPQRQDGLWMQRVKVLGGVLTGEEWRTLAEVARRFTPGTPLHLTTRQDVELHDLRAGDVPLVQAGLAGAGLSGLGGCGDTVRNVTVCPCSGLVPETVDVRPMAWGIRRALEAEDGIYSLPRKFKISLSACRQACGQPWINDVGLTAAKARGQWGFRVCVGGSLGPKPGIGMELFDRLEPGQVLPFVVAAVRVFAEHGDREHRGRARLRHVRERLGDREFAKLLLEGCERVRRERTWPSIGLSEVKDGLPASLALNFANGDVTPEAADALGHLSEHGGMAVRVANHHRVVVYGRDAGELEREVAALPALADAACLKPCVVACPGTRWCKRALTDTNTLADRVRREVSGALPASAAVCISGCPNGCAHSAVADFGVVGGVATRDGAKTEVFSLLVGGGMGRNARLAVKAAESLTQDEVVAEIARRLSR